MKPYVNLNVKHSRATKIRDLSSDILAVGHNDIQKHVDADHKKNKIVDLDLKGLEPTIQPDELKKMAQVKHVINVVVDHDSITNNCVGTGRVQLRLGPHEDLESVKINYMKAGYSVIDHQENPKKKTKFKQEQTLIAKSPSKGEHNAKQAKINHLSSNSPEAFGNSGKHQSKFQMEVKHTELNQDK